MTETDFVDAPASADSSSDDTSSDDTADALASDVAWNLDSLLPEGQSTETLFDQADDLADAVGAYRGRVGELSSAELAELMHTLADIGDVMSRAGYHAMLRFSENTADPERGAAMQRMQERSTAIGTKLIFVDLEFAAAHGAHVVREVLGNVLVDGGFAHSHGAAHDEHEDGEHHDADGPRHDLIGSAVRQVHHDVAVRHHQDS